MDKYEYKHFKALRAGVRRLAEASVNGQPYWSRTGAAEIIEKHPWVGHLLPYGFDPEIAAGWLAQERAAPTEQEALRMRAVAHGEYANLGKLVDAEIAKIEKIHACRV